MSFKQGPSGVLPPQPPKKKRKQDITSDLPDLFQRKNYDVHDMTTPISINRMESIDQQKIEDNVQEKTGNLLYKDSGNMLKLVLQGKSMPVLTRRHHCCAKKFLEKIISGIPKKDFQHQGSSKDNSQPSSTLGEQDGQLGILKKNVIQGCN